MKKKSQKLKSVNNISENNIPKFYLGCDVSINHCALSFSDDNGLINCSGITEIVTVSEKHKNFLLYKQDNIENIENYGFNFARLIHIKNLLCYAFEYATDSTYEQYSNFDIDVLIEGYAYGAQGSVFEIAEITAIFKEIVHSYCKAFGNNFNFYTIPPKTLKKFITGNGNASKELMHSAMNNMFDVYDCKLKNKQTSEDLVDSFALTKFGLELDLWKNGHSSSYFSKLKKSTIDGFKR